MFKFFTTRKATKAQAIADRVWRVIWARECAAGASVIHADEMATQAANRFLRGL